MKVNISYHDETSYSAEEVVRLAHSLHGKGARVEVLPDSFAPHDLIYFALQQIITHRQLALLYDNKFSYQADIKDLRSEVLIKVQEILDSVIIDNEDKVA